MQSKTISFFLLFAFVASVVAASTLTEFFSAEDGEAVRKLLLAAQKKDSTFQDPATAHYAIATLQLLNTPVPNSPAVCTAYKKQLKEAKDSNAIYHAASVVELLQCGEKIDTSSPIISKLRDVLKSKSLPQIYEALSAISLLKQTGHLDFKDDLSFVAELIAELVDDDDGTFRAHPNDDTGSALNAGYAYRSLAILSRSFTLSPDAKASVKDALSTVPTLFKEAVKENDEGLIEFAADNSLENLKTTSLIWIGVNLLPIGVFSIQSEQVTGLAAYFIRNKKVNNAEDAYYLLTALKFIANNTFNLNPLVVSLPKSSILTASKGDEGLIKIHVTNIFGSFATDVSVFISKVYPVGQEKQVILHNQAAQAASKESNNTVFHFNFLATKPEQGYYSLELNVAPVNKKTSYPPVNSIIRTVKVVTMIELSDVSLQIADSKEHDDGFVNAPVNLVYPLKAEITRVNVLQTVLLSFRVLASGRPITLEQAFLRFTNLESGHEVIFVAEQQGKKYKFTLNMYENVDVFNGHSGKYDVALIVGDSLIQNPLLWDLITFNIHFGKFAQEYKPEVSDEFSEIVHKFRVPEKRPSQQVSLFFTALVISPLLILLIGLWRTGANLSNFPSFGLDALYALLFQGCIASVLGLFVLYWLRLNMVVTLQYLLVLVFVSVFFGNRALRYLASRRSLDTKKQQ